MKETNKDSRITVRLTPNQNFMLDTISNEAGVSKSALVRYIIEEFIKRYNDATN